MAGSLYCKYLGKPSLFPYHSAFGQNQWFPPFKHHHLIRVVTAREMYQSQEAKIMTPGQHSYPKAYKSR